MYGNNVPDKVSPVMMMLKGRNKFGCGILTWETHKATITDFPCFHALNALVALKKAPDLARIYLLNLLVGPEGVITWCKHDAPMRQDKMPIHALRGAQ